MRVFISSGGGIRVGASFGAELQGERLGRFHDSRFSHFAGTSAGALDAALTANGWACRDKVRLFLDTDFKRLFSPVVPWGLRKVLAAKWSVSLAGLAKFIDGLGLKPVPNLFVNSVDSQDNKHVIFCEDLPDWLTLTPDDAGYLTSHGGRVRWVTGAYSQLGYGKVLTRSMVLPGLVADEPRWKDGGFGENPLLSIFSQDAQMLLVQLGYAGDVAYKKGCTVPTDLIDEVMYGIDYRSNGATSHMMEHYPGLKVICPQVYDVDSTAFDLDYDAKIDLVERGRLNSLRQWMDFHVPA